MMGRELLGGEGFGFEAEGAIREAAVAVVVIFVDWAGVDQVLEFNLPKDVAEFGIEADLELVTAGRNHPLEHRGVAVLRNGLEILPQVAVIAIGADRNASANGSIEVLGCRRHCLSV